MTLSSAKTPEQLREDARYLGQRFAFPVTEGTVNDSMELRTWLAGQALAGLTLRAINAETIKEIAAAAVLIADTTLLELVKPR